MIVSQCTPNPLALALFEAPFGYSAAIPGLFARLPIFYILPAMEHQFSTLLIVADRAGERQAAISRGLGLARKMGYAVQVVGFCYEPLAAMGIGKGGARVTARKKLLARRRSEVETEIKRHAGSGLRVSTRVIWQEDIHHWLIRQCARKDYAALIKTGSHTESLFYTSTDWHLLRECPAPVMIVAEKQWRTTRPIVAAIDLNTSLRVKQRLNNTVIASARHYAAALGCPLFLINVLYIPPVLTELDLVDEHEQANKLRNELKPKVRQLASLHGLETRQFRLKQGPVDKVITSEAARLKAQLVVMGTVGRTGVKARLMGNTAEKVLTRLRTDVLALKP